jgi:hypothetical protein
MSDEQLDQVSADVGSDTALAAEAIKAGRKSPEERASAEKKAAKLEELMKDAPFLTRVYNVGQREYLLNEKKLPKKEVDDLIGPSLDEPTAAPVKKEKVTPQAPVGQEFDAEGKLIQSPIQTKPVNKSTTPATPPAASPVAPTPKSAPVSSLSNTNSNLNLPRPAADNDIKPVVNKTINNVSQKQERTGLRPSQISVRNDEPTFMQLIVDSTRVV